MKGLIEQHKTFLKYIVSAGLSFGLDIGLFTIFLILFKDFMGDLSIILATVCARIISSFFNYLMNRNAVFKVDNKKTDMSSLFKYYLLVVINMLVSALLVLTLFKMTDMNETIIKMPVDVLIFISNYFIQKKIIFVKKQEGE